MKHIKQVDIVLENCDYFSVPIEHINLMCDGITRQISSWNGDGTVLDSLIASKVVMFISSEAYNIQSNFAKETDDDIPLRKELTEISNITHVDIIYDDGTHDYITVPWKGDSEYINEAQKIEITEKRMTIRLEATP